MAEKADPTSRESDADATVADQTQVSAEPETASTAPTPPTFSAADGSTVPERPDPAALLSGSVRASDAYFSESSAAPTTPPAVGSLATPAYPAAPAYGTAYAPGPYAPGPAAPGASPYQSYPAAPAEPKLLSILSMTFGIVGLVFPLVSIVAVVLGHMGLRKEKVAGRPFWMTGLITGYIGIAFFLVVIVVLVVYIVAMIIIFSATASSLNFY